MDTQQQTDRLAYTYKEAVEATRLSRSTLASAVTTGDLKVVRHGRRVLIPRAELERFLKEGSSGRFAE